MRRPLLSFLLALCAAALLPRSALCAPSELSLHDPSSRLDVGFSAFVGESFGVTLFNPLPLPASDPSAVQAFVVAKCDSAAFRVTPAVHCLTQSLMSFTVTVVATQAGSVAQPCRFALVGDGDALAQYGVAQLNAAPQLASWTVRLPETLRWEGRLQQSAPANPTRVHDGLYSFNFSRASGALENGALCHFAPQCNSELVFATGGAAAVSATGGNVALRFANQGRASNYAMCTFERVVCDDPADQFRYVLPPIYFRIGLAADLLTQIRVAPPAGGFTTSATANTTNVLTVSPVPDLQWPEWLSIRVADCWSASINGQGQKVSPGLGEFGAADSPLKRWGTFASANAGPSILLPPLVSGALRATCRLALEGSAEALLRYTLAPTSATIEIDLGRTVTLTPTFDTSIWSQSSATVVVGANTPRVRFVPDRAVVIGDLRVAIACGECDGSNGAYGTGYVTRTGVVNDDEVEDTRIIRSTSTSLRFPARAHAANLTSSPFFEFAASSFDSRHSSVLQTCYFSLSGDDAKYFQLSAPSTSFRLVRRQALGMTASNGVVSLYRVDGESGEATFDGYTPAAIPPARARDTVVTVAVPVGLELQVGFNCTRAGVDTAAVVAEGGAAVRSIFDGSEFFTAVGFERTTPASAVARFRLPTTLVEQPTPGQLVYCRIQLFGRDAAHIASPPFGVRSVLSFHVGTPVQLSAHVNTATEGDRVFRSSAESGTVDHVNRVFVNISAPDGSDATVYDSAPRLDVTCTSDVIDSASSSGETTVYKSVAAYDAATQTLLGPASGSVNLEVGPIVNQRRFFVLLDDPSARTVRCAYAFRQLATLDQRRFLAPPTTVISVRPQAVITPSGPLVAAADANAVESNHFARIAPGSTATLTLASSEAPLSGEAVDVAIDCGAEITPLTVVRAVTSEVRAVTWTLTAPAASVIPAGTGRLYTCSLQILPSSTSVGKWRLAASVFKFAVGDVATWSASASQLSLYAGAQSTAVRFTPSACRSALNTIVWQCTVVSPDTGKAVPFLQYGGSSVTAIDRADDVHSLSVIAPSSGGPSTGAYDVTCRVSRMDYSWVAAGYSRPFETPRSVVFRVQPRATFEFVGLRDLAVDESQYDFAVRPSVAPGVHGVQVHVHCDTYEDTNTVDTAADVYLFWFAGSTEAQTVRWTKPSSRTVNGYKCRIDVDEQHELSDDHAHYVGVEAARRIGAPVDFAVTVDTNYFAANRCARGVAQLHMRPTGSLNKRTSVRLQCARADNFQADGSLKQASQRLSPDVSVYTSDPAGGFGSCSSSPCELSFSPAAACDVSSAQPFWLVNEVDGHGDVYTGEVRCAYTAPSAPFTAAMPLATRALYTGVTPPPDNDDGLSGGAIAGIVIGVIVGVALLGALAYVLLKNKSAAGVQQAPERKPAPATVSPAPTPAADAKPAVEMGTSPPPAVDAQPEV